MLEQVGSYNEDMARQKKEEFDVYFSTEQLSTLLSRIKRLAKIMRLDQRQLGVMLFLLSNDMLEGLGIEVVDIKGTERKNLM